MLATKSGLSALVSVPIGPRAPRSGRVFRSSPRDAWLVAIAVLHGVLVGSVVALAPRGLAAIAACGAVALATLYTSNTVAHWHLHSPLFRSRAASRALSLGLTLALGIPQTAWAQRHRWHHAGEPVRRSAMRMTARLGIETALVLAVVAVLVTLRPMALATLVPGVGFGLGLAWIQGRLEHAGDPDVARSGVSHYGSLYNLLWFNDGFHAEHHRAPGTHWSHLPTERRAPPITSRRAPILRWLDALERGELQALVLGALERVALLFPAIQEWLVRRHADALVRVLAGHRRPKTVLAVGGGLFPRTALVLARVFPGADVTVLDG